MSPADETMDVDSILNTMLDTLSSIEHDRWSHWQRYMHGRGALQPDGSLVIPPDLVARWTAQMNTNFFSLTEKEKESDREQVRKYLPLISDELRRCLGLK